MNKILRLASVLVCGVFIFGCKENAPNKVFKHQATLELAINPYDEKVPDVQEVFDIFAYIPLETTPKSVFSSIIEVIMYEDTFIILTKITDSQKGVLRFDSSGKFIGAIGSYGKGPADFTSLMDMSVDKEQKEIYLLDSNRILIFDLHGNFLRKKDLDTYYDEIEVIDSTSYLLSKKGYYVKTEEPYHLFLYKNDTLQDKFLPIEPILKMGSPLNYQRLKRSNNQIYYLKEFSDSLIFTYSESNFIPHLRTNFNEYSLSSNPKIQEKITAFNPDNNLSNFHVFELKRELESQYVSDFINYWECENLSLLQYRFRRKNYKIILDKKENKIYNYEHIYQNKNSIFDNLPLGILEDNSGFVYGLTTEMLMDQEYVKLAELEDERLQKIQEDLDDTDNPVLVMVKAKAKAEAEIETEIIPIPQ